MGLPHHFTTLRFQSECVNKKISTKKKIKKKNKQEKAEENESFPAHLEANGHMTHLAETVFFRWLLLLRLFVTCSSLSFRHLFSKVAKGVLVDLDLFLPPVLYRTITKNKNIDWICTDVITLTHAYGRCSEWSNIQVTLSNSHL